MHATTFLHAIAEGTDADISRAVYADWLEENGDTAQAEFIRVQLQLATMDEEDERRAALAVRERELLIEHGMHWARVLVDHTALYWTFRRGTLAWAEFTLKDFLAHGQAVLDLTPVRRFRLHDARDLGSLAASPLLARVRRLDLLHNGLDDVALAELAASPHLGQLEALALAESDFTSAGLARLLAAPSLVSLDKFDLTSLPECGEGIGAVLAGAPSLSRLRVLDLDYTPLDTASLRTLANSPHLARLERLRLPGCPQARAGVLAVVGSTCLPSLRSLEVSCVLEEDMTTTLLESPLAATLEELSSSGSSPDAFAQLLRLPRIRTAARVRIGSLPEDSEQGPMRPSRGSFPGGQFWLKGIHPATTTTILTREVGWPHLRWLGLHISAAEDAAGDLADWPVLDQLTTLDLRTTPLATNPLIRVLERSGRAGLRRLDLRQTGEETALAVVSAAGSLVGLQTLLPDERTPPVDLEGLAVSPLVGTCSRRLQSLRQMWAWLEPFRHSFTWPEGCWPRAWDGAFLVVRPIRGCSPDASRRPAGTVPAPGSRSGQQRLDPRWAARLPGLAPPHGPADAAPEFQRRPG
jgi:uncharacterized protein (TIGR02996 family)